MLLRYSLCYFQILTINRLDTKKPLYHYRCHTAALDRRPFTPSPAMSYMHFKYFSYKLNLLAKVLAQGEV